MCGFTPNSNAQTADIVHFFSTRLRTYKFTAAFGSSKFRHDAAKIRQPYVINDSVAGGRQSRSPSTSLPVLVLVLHQGPLRRGVRWITCRPMEKPSGPHSNRAASEPHHIRGSRVSGRIRKRAAEVPAPLPPALVPATRPTFWATAGYDVDRPRCRT